jgi:signal transduction histidine kinase
MKHARANKVKLSVAITAGQIKFEVADDGCGMPGKLRPTGNGLKNMRKRMDDIGGCIEWKNTPQGLHVVYTFKTK